ncbi:MAG: phosphoenolpyruvate carboxylase, partial [Pseudomonadota bacterium]
MTPPLRRTDVVFSDKDRALRKDVRRLGAMIGALLKEQGGEELFERVERARRLSIRRRDGDTDADLELVALLKSLSPAAAESVIRAFSTYFQMVNTAEKVHRIRRWRQRFQQRHQLEVGVGVAVT